MAVHNFELTTSQTDTGGAHIEPVDTRPQLDNWLSNRQRVLQEQDNTFSGANTEIDGTGIDYYRGLWRFDMAEGRDNIMTPLQTLVSNNFEWGVIRYHVCDHDEDQPEGCSWDRKWENGVVPDEIRSQLNLDNIVSL